MFATCHMKCFAHKNALDTRSFLWFCHILTSCIKDVANEAQTDQLSFFTVYIHICMDLCFSVIDQKKLSHFSQKVKKYTLMNTVTASFDRTVRQMTKMLHKKMTEMSQRNKGIKSVKSAHPLLFNPRRAY